MRQYKLTDLVRRSGISARTISDYVAKGLLIGPSHCGRGAVYSQRDFDALQVIPNLRMLMPSEYSSLKSIAHFFARLSAADLHSLANLRDENTFLETLRRIRLQIRLQALFPTSAPERIAVQLSALTATQLQKIDRGELPVGAVLSLRALSAPRRHAARATQRAVSTDRSSPRYLRLTEGGIEILIEAAATGLGANGPEIVAAVREFADRLESLVERPAEFSPEARMAVHG